MGRDGGLGLVKPGWKLGAETLLPAGMKRFLKESVHVAQNPSYDSHRTRNLESSGRLRKGPVSTIDRERSPCEAQRIFLRILMMTGKANASH